MLCSPLGGEIMADLFSAFYYHSVVSIEERRLLLKSEENNPNTATCHVLHACNWFTSPTPMLSHFYYSCTSTDRLETLWGQGQLANPYLLLYAGHIIYYTLSVTGTHLIHKNGSYSSYQESFSPFFPSTSVPPISKFPSLVHLWVIQVRACVFA